MTDMRKMVDEFARLRAAVESLVESHNVTQSLLLNMAAMLEAMKPRPVGRPKKNG